MYHVSLDIETLGAASAPDIAVLSIGAIAFELSERALEPTEHNSINIVLPVQPQLDRGAKVDDATVKWWIKQGSMARNAVTAEPLHESVEAALDDINEFFNLFSVDNKPPLVWGNGPGFDNSTVRTTFRRFGKEWVVPYNNDRCIRTLRETHGGKIVRQGVAHDALDDAVDQGNYVLDKLDILIP